MAKHLFGSDNQPTKRRGKSYATLLVEALKRAGESEEQFLDRAVNHALEGDMMIFREILVRLSPVPKATYPNFTVDIRPEDSPADKLDKIIAAVANAEIPADVAAQMAQLIKAAIEVREVTELVQRLERLEQLLAERANA